MALKAPIYDFGYTGRFGDEINWGDGIILAPTVRALMQGGRDDVLWNVIQEDTQPSHGFFMASTTANPDGLTTLPGFWDLHDSKNHMILLQIEEWFHSGLAGIRQAPGSVGYRQLVIDPRVVHRTRRARRALVPAAISREVAPHRDTTSSTSVPLFGRRPGHRRQPPGIRRPGGLAGTGSGPILVSGRALTCDSG